MPSTEVLAGELPALTALLIFSANIILTKVASRHGPRRGTGTALLPHLAMTRGDPAGFSVLRQAARSGVLLFALSGSLSIIAQMCTIAAMRHLPVALVALITLCTPVLVFPASWFLLGNQERITTRTHAGATLTLCGIALLLVPR